MIFRVPFKSCYRPIRLFLVLLLPVLLVACKFGSTDPSDSKEGEAAADFPSEPVRTEKEPASVTLDFRQDSLKSVDLTGLNPSNPVDTSAFTFHLRREFNRQGRRKGSEAIRDSLFATLVLGLPAFLNEANEELYNSEAYLVYEQAVYDRENNDQAPYQRMVDSVAKLGLRVVTQEGVLYLQEDPDYIERFQEGLSPRMQTFARQYVRELRLPFWVDASIQVSVDEHRERLLFWEEFCRKEKDLPLRDYACDRYQAYLYVLMFGSDNTPIYGWDGTDRIRPELIEAYRDIAGRQECMAAPKLSEYLLFLEENEYRYKEEKFRLFARQIFPDNPF